jgi:hypothetical protein
MDMITCLYCGESKDMQSFSGEHVMPRSFGKFLGILSYKELCVQSMRVLLANTLMISIA